MLKLNKNTLFVSLTCTLLGLIASISENKAYVVLLLSTSNEVLYALLTFVLLADSAFDCLLSLYDS